jgi:hypothetical protein
MSILVTMRDGSRNKFRVGLSSSPLLPLASPSFFFLKFVREA